MTVIYKGRVHEVQGGPDVGPEKDGERETANEIFAKVPVQYMYDSCTSELGNGTRGRLVGW